MESIWKKDAPRVQFDTLKENKSTNILIVGGGIAGILCAYRLKNAGVDCLLTEATEIYGGITKKSMENMVIVHLYACVGIKKSVQCRKTEGAQR